MTSIRGYHVVSAPCCGARYARPAYLSINLSGWHRWTDGYTFGRLYRRHPSVCLCSCGAYFMASDAEQMAYVDFGDDVTEKLPALPWLSDKQAYAAIEERRPFPDAQIECEARLQYWHLLNHRYRVMDESHEAGLRTMQASPCRSLTEAEIDERIFANLEQLTPLLEKFHSSDSFLIGEACRARGLMDEAIAHFKRAAKEEPAIIEHLIELANARMQRLVRIEPPDWQEKPKRPEPWINRRPYGETVNLASRDYWFKIFGMLNQLWALIEPCRQDSGVTLYKIDDNSGIVDTHWFTDEGLARVYLLQHGWQRYEAAPDAWSFLVPPGGIFHFSPQAAQTLRYRAAPRATAKSLALDGTLPIRWHARLETEPEIHIETDVAARIEGMMLGLAIGDALGNTSESLLPADRRARYGHITDYLPNRHAGGARIGLPSDDTHLHFGRWSIW